METTDWRLLCRVFRRVQERDWGFGVASSWVNRRKLPLPWVAWSQRQSRRAFGRLNHLVRAIEGNSSMANAEQTEVNQFVRKREELRGSILELENDISNVERELERVDLSEEDQTKLWGGVFRGLQAHRVISKEVDLCTVAIDEANQRLKGQINVLNVKIIGCALMLVALACFVDDLPDFLDEVAYFLRYLGA